MIIECKKLTKIYQSDGTPLKAVDNVSLVVEKGDFVVIMGHSGSGKTTLLSLIGGLTAPDSGQVLINNQEIRIHDDKELSTMRNRTFGFIFQFASLIPTLTCIENVLLPLSFGKKPAGDKRLAMELLDLVGLGEKINSFPSQLSGGQQRRVSIARSFINKPAIILADEPTGDLDEETEADILNVFKKINEEQNTTFLIVTHNNDLAKVHKNPRIFNMGHGVLREEV